MEAMRDEGCPYGIDPPTQVTIASVAMTIFRAKFLPETGSVKLSTGNTFTATCLNGQYKVDKVRLYDYLGPTVKVVDKKFETSPIAHIPSNVYTRQDQFSDISIQWLEWRMQKGHIFIPHALNHQHGEKTVLVDGHRYRLDGYCKATNTI